MTPARRSRAAYAAFLEALIQLREQAGLSHQALAGRLGVPAANVAAGEAGQRRVDVLELQRWAFACGSSLTEFMGRLDERVGRRPDRLH